MVEPGPGRTLSAALRAATLDVHVKLEGQPFARDLVHGRVGLDGVAALLTGLRPVYAALDEAVRRYAGDPLVGVFCLTVPDRTARLDADLTVLHGLGAAAPPAGRAAADYAARVADASAWPLGFLAHHRTRRLADLSGGQVIAAALARTLGLDAARGASWLAFDPAPARLLEQYRVRLDALLLDAAQRRELCEETRRAHELNVGLLGELGRTHPGAPAPASPR